MARKIVIKIYKFKELSVAAKEKARDWYRKGLFDYDWWNSTYEDAANVGIKITSFDIGGGNNIEGKFTNSAVDTARSILKEHGGQTYKDAEAFLADYDFTEESDDEDWKIAREREEKNEELDKEFLRTILEDYLTMLRREAEYLESDEQIDESIISNEYEFTKDGSRY